MFENVDGKQFIDVSAEMGQDFLRSGYQRGSAFVDLNNDGFLDVVVNLIEPKTAHPAEFRRQWRPLAVAPPDRPQE